MIVMIVILPIQVVFTKKIQKLYNHKKYSV